MVNEWGLAGGYNQPPGHFGSCCWGLAFWQGGRTPQAPGKYSPGSVSYLRHWIRLWFTFWGPPCRTTSISILCKRPEVDTRSLFISICLHFGWYLLRKIVADVMCAAHDTFKQRRSVGTYRQLLTTTYTAKQSKKQSILQHQSFKHSVTVRSAIWL